MPIFIGVLNGSVIFFADLIREVKIDCEIDFKIDYIGFEIGDEFVIGYGLDYAQKGRNLKAIYVIDSQK